MKKITTAIILIAAVAAVVYHRASFATTIPNSFCPKIIHIKKNPTDENWVAQTKQGRWKSFQSSFATNLTKFVGAQWVGEAVGKVRCVYNAEQRFVVQGNPQIKPMIPVTIAYQTLIFQPTEGKWHHSKTQHGVYNCYSLNRKDCPFKVRAQADVGNIYDEAESLKSNDNDNNTQIPGVN